MESPFCTSDDPDFRLIETFGFAPGQGVARLDLHLARLTRSAEAFGIPFRRAEALAMVEDLAATTPLRCRMTLAADGFLALTTAEMPAAANLWRVGIAQERLASDEPLLRHKTTRREIYDRARARLPAGIDEVIFFNEREEICEGTITNLVLTREDGTRLTPPVSSGCLPGVYRQSLLDAGSVKEAVLTMADLQRAAALHLTNALRGEIPATLFET